LYQAISAKCLAKEEQRATLRSRASLSKKSRRSRLPGIFGEESNSICIINLWYVTNETRWKIKKDEMKIFNDILVYEKE